METRHGDKRLETTLKLIFARGASVHGAQLMVCEGSGHEMSRYHSILHES